ncbi:MAG TPA: Clp protease N-terminal domain-containing protein [Phycisphaerae bacterium]|nr:Clp protease N-terminal domain-containing protein [Phycisphaerae bacterium]
MIQITRRAEAILRLAKEIARADSHGFVGTEHLLLGIVREGTGLGAQILRDRGVTEPLVREELAKLNQDRLSETWVLGRLPGTPNFRDLLSKAAEAARGSGNWQVCSIHLLMALLNEKDSTGYKTLKALGVTLEEVRKAIVRQAGCCRQGATVARR